jgi:hypothetical protein
MDNTFICQGCGQQRRQNPRLKGRQRFCGQPDCQKARKAAWRRAKMHTDPVFKKSQEESQENWCKNKPLCRYQDEYRIQHPAYTKKNRRKQRIRNRKKSSATEIIVKIDALSNRETVVYVPHSRPEKIVKIDTFPLNLILNKEVSIEL